jgi:hypothetical protein
MAPNVDRLIQDIEAPIKLLAISLFILYINSRMARRSESYLIIARATLTFLLFCFVVMLCGLMYQDRATLEALWMQNPPLYSLAYITGCILVLAGVAALSYWKLRPELWRKGNYESNQ